MKTFAALVFISAAAVAAMPSAQATELALPSLNTQSISAFTAEFIGQQVLEVKTAILEQSQKALAELDISLVQVDVTEPETVIAVAKVD